MKMISTIALFSTLMWCAAAAPMGDRQGPTSGAQQGVASGAGMGKPAGGPGAGGPPGMMGGMGGPDMGFGGPMPPMPLNISSQCLAAINTTCTTCPAPPTGTPTQPPSNGSKGPRGPAPGNNTQMNTCFECMQTNIASLIAAGCDHLKCPAAMAATCPDCPRPGANDSCRALCEKNRNSTECTACRNKCRVCIDQNTDALIAAGCKDLACAKVINTTCPNCAPNDACRAACDANRNSTDCTQCTSKRTACDTCLTTNNATLTAAGCPPPQGPKGGNFALGGGMGKGGNTNSVTSNSVGGGRGRPTTQGQKKGQ